MSLPTARLEALELEPPERVLADLESGKAGLASREAARRLLAAGPNELQSRTRRTWTRGTVNGTTQGATLLLMRVAIIGFALFLWSNGEASAGDITFVLT